LNRMADIEVKLLNVINVGITSEPLAVYLLTEVRKLMERQNVKGFEFLRFHCNWALHPKLTNTTAQEILMEFEKQHIQLKEQMGANDLPQPFRTQIEKISKMSQFRNELNDFLGAHSLPPIDTGKGGWTRFLFHYCQVIADCPLEIKPSNEESTVEKVTVTVEQAKESQGGEHFYRISWTITEKSGQTGVIDIYNSFAAVG
jgi:hypothetical protein